MNIKIRLKPLKKGSKRYSYKLYTSTYTKSDSKSKLTRIQNLVLIYFFLFYLYSMCYFLPFFLFYYLCIHLQLLHQSPISTSNYSPPLTKNDMPCSSLNPKTNIASSRPALLHQSLFLKILERRNYSTIFCSSVCGSDNPYDACKSKLPNNVRNGKDGQTRSPQFALYTSASIHFWSRSFYGITSCIYLKNSLHRVSF